jgi:hypothetical protein
MPSVILLEMVWVVFETSSMDLLSVLVSLAHDLFGRFLHTDLFPFDNHGHPLPVMWERRCCRSYITGSTTHLNMYRQF